MKLLLRIAYVGTRFHGFQVQPGLRTVQGTLQKALEDFFGEKLMLTGASRTDAGVHAKDFALTVEGNLFPSMPPEKLPLALAPYLPPDLSVLSATRVPEDFHPRYGVDYKEYQYLILNAPVRDPFYADRAWFDPIPLDLDRMNLAAKMLVGRHDFSAFMAQGSSVSTTVRTVRYFYAEREGNLVRIVVAADGFLYNMVRILAGTLVAVSDGKLDPADLPAILESGDRRRAGATLPPEGLYLCKVVYPPEMNGKELP
ncbi:MAG: tRNA pseudouridine(38-40) synthase TruA [Eubacteriales bacterium]